MVQRRERTALISVVVVLRSANDLPLMAQFEGGFASGWRIYAGIGAFCYTG